MTAGVEYVGITFTATRTVTTSAIALPAATSTQTLSQQRFNPP